MQTAIAVGIPALEMSEKETFHVQMFQRDFNINVECVQRNIEINKLVKLENLEWGKRTAKNTLSLKSYFRLSIKQLSLLKSPSEAKT